MTDYLHKDLTYKIIGAAMEVHRVLGPGFLEAVYQAALAREFTLQKIPFQREVDFDVIYKEDVVGHYRADFFVDSKVIMETKATKG